MDLVSIVVPVYKVEKYLSRCVDSLINQTYQNIEIILVDDGSPDKCGEICEKYAEIDNRIKVIHKENGGLSDARNAGIDIATGKYITFVDSDDYVSKNMIVNLMRGIKEGNTEISCIRFIMCPDSGVDRLSETKNATFDTYIKEDFLEKMLYQEEIDNSAWGKLYNRDLFEGVRYPKGKLYEDLATTYKLLHKTDRVAVSHSDDYYYVQQENSIMHMNFNPSKMDAIENMSEWYGFIEKNYPKQLPAARSKFISVAFNIWKQIPFVKEYKLAKERCWAIICEYRKSVIADSRARKMIRLGAMCSYLGQHVCMWILNKGI